MPRESYRGDWRKRARPNEADGANRQLRDYGRRAREAERLQEARQKLADLAAWRSAKSPA